MTTFVAILPSFKTQLLHGLWIAFKWPFIVWMIWMLLRMFIGPVWKAIAKTFSK